MVEQRLHVMHLMRGDNHRGVVGHVAGHHLAELALGRYVEAVGRLVHEQDVRACGKGETHVHLLLLTHGQRAEMHVGRQSEVGKRALDDLAAEARIERTVGAYELLKRDVGQVKLLRHDEHVAQHGHTAPPRVRAIHEDSAVLLAQQTTDEVEQCALAGAVLAEQPVDTTLLEVKAEPIVYRGRRLVTESNVADLYHIIICYVCECT